MVFDDPKANNDAGAATAAPPPAAPNLKLFVSFAGSETGLEASEDEKDEKSDLKGAGEDSFSVLDSGTVVGAALGVIPNTDTVSVFPADPAEKLKLLLLPREKVPPVLAVVGGLLLPKLKASVPKLGDLVFGESIVLPKLAG